MKSWKTPTPEQIAAAVRQLTHIEKVRYFFDNLENPEWIVPLRERGFFKDPPEPEREETKGTIRIWTWPHSRYLARMAPKKPEAVIQVIAEMRDTENPRVREDLVDAALAMPPALSVRFVDRFSKWAKASFHALLPGKLAQLVVHWAEAEHSEASLQLTSSLLELRLPHPRDPSSPSVLRELDAYIDEWDYGEAVKAIVPVLSERAGMKALETLSALLSCAVELRSHAGGGEPREELSFVWRPAIEDHEQNRSEDVLDYLVNAVRDTAELVASRSPDDFGAVIGHLEAGRTRMFARIILYLLRKFPDTVPDLLEQHLVRREVFDDLEVYHELGLLMTTCFGRLNPVKQQVILDWITEGPAMDDFIKGTQYWDGRPPTVEEISRHRESWQSHILAWIKEQLTGEARSLYDRLVRKYGEPEQPYFLAYMSSFSSWGPGSPKTADELHQLPVEELVRYLQTWRAPEDERDASPEGMGRELEAAIAKDTDKYSTTTDRFKGLDPVYVRSVVQGIANAARQGNVKEWLPVLNLCSWVVSQPREIPGRKTKSRMADPDWGWTRKAILRLFAAGTGNIDSPIPIKFRAKLWEILQPLTDDPDPLPAKENEYLDEKQHWDPEMLSINTVRGEALHCVVRYGLWVRRHIGNGDSASERLARGLEEMPEVRKVLERHLDISSDPSRAIRAVYGQWFPWLVLLDERWTQRYVSIIFPTAQVEFFRASWETYLRFCPPYDNVLPLVRDIYAHAVESMSVITGWGEHGHEAVGRLASHLITFSWRGKIENAGQRGLLDRFFELAPGWVRTAALRHAGRSLKETKGDPPDEVLGRLRQLWEVRLESAKRCASIEERRSEMETFGYWFSAGKYDDEWACMNLKEAIHLAGGVEADHLVLERLAEVGENRPDLAAQCLYLLVKNDKEDGTIFHWGDAIRAILESATRKGDRDTRELLKQVIDEMGRKGHLEYREYLRP